MTAQARIFDVQRFSIHDGPGIRTVVFFKGCSLRCAWCQNPEGLAPAQELAYFEDRCLDGCAACVGACPEAALRPIRSGRVDFERCTACGACIDPCPSDALRIVGRSVGPEELLSEVLRDRTFHQATGGGVTLSGGEAVLQGDFLEAFLPLAKAAGIHVVLETAGNYPFRLLEPLLPFLDLVLFDVKLADPELHREATGTENHLLLENLAALVRRRHRVQVRMPVVPGINDGPSDVEGFARLLSSLGIGALRLLPYNPLWEAKLPRLAHGIAPLGIRARDDAYYADLVEAFGRSGIAASV